MQCCHRQLYLVFLLILALLPLVVVGDEAVIPHATGKHPRACRPEDARCIALQRDVCDPWNVSATDK